MDEKHKIFTIMVDESTIEDFSDKAEKENEEDREFPSFNFAYVQFDLNELAILAKKDDDAREEVLMRSLPTIQHYCRATCSLKKYLPYSELYTMLQKTTNVAIDAFDPNRGTRFAHLLRRMYQISAKNFEKNEAIRYFRERTRMYQGAFDYEALEDSGVIEEDIKDEVINKVDRETFEDSLSETDKNIYILFKLGYTFRQIGARLDMASSTVAYRIYVITKRAKKLR